MVAVKQHFYQTETTTSKKCAKNNLRYPIANARHSDTVFGYQLVAGVDYQLREAMSLGLKLRWADFGEFEHEREWDQLRSHDSARRPGGERVRYKLITDDLRFLSLGLNLKYQF